MFGSCLNSASVPSVTSTPAGTEPDAPLDWACRGSVWGWLLCYCSTVGSISLTNGRRNCMEALFSDPRIPQMGWVNNIYMASELLC